MTTFVHHSETVLCQYGMASYYKTIDRPTGSALHSLNNVVANLLGKVASLAMRGTAQLVFGSVKLERSRNLLDTMSAFRRRHSAACLCLYKCPTHVRNLSLPT